MLEHVRRFDTAFGLADVVFDLLELRAVVLDHDVDRRMRMVAVIVGDAHVDQLVAILAEDGEVLVVVVRVQRIFRMVELVDLDEAQHAAVVDVQDEHRLAFSPSDVGDLRSSRRPLVGEIT